MNMEFTYQDFLDNYYDNPSLKPTTPLEPHRCIDRGKFPESEEAINKKIETTKKALEQRMGGEYFSKYDRARTLSLGYASTVFPAYSMLYLDIACEDWLSLVDFHKGFGRDHSVHQPLTAYIVSKLLGEGKEDAGFEIGGETLMKKIPPILPVPLYFIRRLSLQRCIMTWDILGSLWSRCIVC